MRARSFSRRRGATASRSTFWDTIGGKTVLYLIDGLYSGKHPVGAHKWASAPFLGRGLRASIPGPVAIDSVGFVSSRQWDDYPQPASTTTA